MTAKYRHNIQIDDDFVTASNNDMQIHSSTSLAMKRYQVGKLCTFCFK